MKNLLVPFRATALLIGALVAASTPLLFGQTVDVLDQSQTAANLWQDVYQENDAQSFIPTQDKLSKVEVELMVGSGALSSLQLTILGDDGTGQPDVANPLATVTPAPGPDAVVSGDLTVGWFVAELNNLPVQPGHTYYLRLNLPATSPDLRANWAAADGTLDPAYDNLYPNGLWWFGVGSMTPPLQFPHRDGTFRTYYPQAADPIAMLQALEDTVRSMDLNKGLEKRFIRELNAAISDLQQNNVAGCLAQLQSFTTLVQSQKTGKKLTSAQAVQLVELAGEVVSVLQ